VLKEKLSEEELQDEDPYTKMAKEIEEKKKGAVK
jgi:hypothetical protein